MDIIFASFQGVIKSKPQGMVRLMLPIFDRLNKRIPDVHMTYYVGSQLDQSIEHQNIKPLHKNFQKFKNLISVVLNLFFFVRNSSGWKRFIQEILFDFILAFRLEAPVLLVSSCYSVRAFRKNKRLGGINVLVAGNPDDRVIYSILKAEMHKKGVYEINDPYTLKERLQYIDKCLSYCDRIVYHTITQMETFSKTFPLDNSFYKEIMIHPKYIVPKFQPRNRNGKIVFCYLAHTVWLKGLSYLLSAWEKLRFENVELIVGGKIDSSVQNYIDNYHPCCANVRFMGAIDDVNKFYAMADICVVPSLMDAGPVTVAEALISGLPVICTSTCGAKTLIDDGCGIVIAPCNSDEILSAINLILTKIDVYDPMLISKRAVSALEDNNYDDFCLYFERLQKELK